MLTSLPGDILLMIAERLLREHPVALVALERCTSAIRGSLAADRLWTTAAAKQGLALASSSSPRSVVLALACTEQLLGASEAGLVGSRMHVMCSARQSKRLPSCERLLPLLYILDREGLVSFANSRGEVPAACSSSIVLVPCDALNGTWSHLLVGGKRYLTSNGRSHPCARRCCHNPALEERQHCQKHCASGAFACVEMCASERQIWDSSAGGGPRKYVFLTPTEGCRNAYQRAIEHVLCQALAGSATQQRQQQARGCSVVALE